jgi:hypothetical protein
MGIMEITEDAIKTLREFSKLPQENSETFTLEKSVIAQM